MRQFDTSPKVSRHDALITRSHSVLLHSHTVGLRNLTTKSDFFSDVATLLDTGAYGLKCEFVHNGYDTIRDAILPCARKPTFESA